MPGCQKVYCNCGTPVAEIENGVLVIRVKHFDPVRRVREEHVTRIVLAALDKERVLVLT